MERPDKNETLLKTFNTAKLFAEGILFPKMKLFQEFQTQADFGHKNMEDAQEVSEEVRDLQRYNGLKGMCETVYNLLLAISSTVRIKGNTEEVTQLKNLLEYTEGVKNTFYNDREKFFITVFRNGNVMDTLDRKHFDKVKSTINIVYINAEILMTRNKLLFADANDEFVGDKEILDQLKQEYIDG